VRALLRGSAIGVSPARGVFDSSPRHANQPATSRGRLDEAAP